jgi:hypothetical protein
MAALDVITPVGIIFGADVGWRRCCSGVNPRSGSPGSNDGDARHRSPCWGHHFWSRPWLEVALRWSGMSLSVSAVRHLRGYSAGGVEVTEWRSQRRLWIGLWLRLSLRRARQAARGSWRGRWWRGMRGGGGSRCGGGVEAGEARPGAQLPWVAVDVVPREGRHPRGVVHPASGSIRGHQSRRASAGGSPGARHRLTSAAAWLARVVWKRSEVATPWMQRRRRSRRVAG